MTASMHHDLQAGRPLELQWLAGGVVDLGAKAGVPTPMNRAVRDILMLHSQGKPAGYNALIAMKPRSKCRASRSAPSAPSASRCR